MKRFAAFVAAAALSACATPIGTSPAAPGAPSTPIEFGDYGSASEAATLNAFREQIAGRYAAGMSLNVAAADLGRHDFNCGAAPPALEQARSEPPARVCRRTVTEAGCTHTWQVHLYARQDALESTRGLYDRRCGNDGLLGGPG